MKRSKGKRASVTRRANIDELADEILPVRIVEAINETGFTYEEVVEMERKRPPVRIVATGETLEIRVVLSIPKRKFKKYLTVSGLVALLTSGGGWVAHHFGQHL